MSLIKECNSIMNNIVQDSVIILQRNNVRQTKKLKEITIGFSIELGELNKETLELLNESIN